MSYGAISYSLSVPYTSLSCSSFWSVIPVCHDQIAIHVSYISKMIQTCLVSLLCIHSLQRRCCLFSVTVAIDCILGHREETHYQISLERIVNTKPTNVSISLWIYFRTYLFDPIQLYATDKKHSKFGYITKTTIDTQLTSVDIQMPSHAHFIVPDASNNVQFYLIAFYFLTLFSVIFHLFHLC